MFYFKKIWIAENIFLFLDLVAYIGVYRGTTLERTVSVCQRMVPDNERLFSLEIVKNNGYDS